MQMEASEHELNARAFLVLGMVAGFLPVPYTEAHGSRSVIEYGQLVRLRREFYAQRAVDMEASSLRLWQKTSARTGMRNLRAN
jgi:hypothetical protein